MSAAPFTCTAAAAPFATVVDAFGRLSARAPREVCPECLHRHVVDVAPAEPLVMHYAPPSAILAAIEAGEEVTGLCGFRRVPVRPRPANYVVCPECERLKAELQAAAS